MAKMTPSVLLLSALLALSSASLQDIVKRNVVKRNVVKRSIHSQGDVGPGLFGYNVNLQWQWSTGSLPNGAVSIYNHYEGRTDYVCKSDCEPGFYNPSLGHYCHYPYGDREHKATQFDILVNKDHFEVLEWKEDSWGSVPSHSVRTCMGVNTYVGKNKYGLGKVVPRHKAFFLPSEGKEYYYKSYEVLVINRDYYRQHISNVNYANNAIPVQNLPETMTKSSITNNDCQVVKKTVTLSTTTEVQSTWNIGRSTTVGVTSTISAQIPFTASLSVTVENVQHSSEGSTLSKSYSPSVSVEVNIPPNHSCTVRMEGRKGKVDIPYTATLSRTYNNGQTRSTYISGMYKGVQTGDIRAVVDRCEPVANPKPCPLKTDRGSTFLTEY
ncbi:natterin-3-like [Cololabis saira]|uniref:natterin-3-like n=1 Tax=Cololabis saira TaxID=129043 RepID=UPI002AD34FD3|nr:natterin-3-like [Cololabis saira]